MKNIFIILLLPLFASSQAVVDGAGNIINYTKLSDSIPGIFTTGHRLKVKTDSLATALAAELVTSLAAKQNTITLGTTAQYFRGDLSLITFPTTTAPFANSTDKNFVTDAKLTVVNNTTGTNSGDNAVNTLYSGLVSNANHTGDATGSTALTVVRINGVSLSGLATGILKNTTTTGVPSIAVAGDFPTLNQNTTGTAAGLSAVLSFANGGISASAATSATTGTMTVNMTSSIITITPTGACTFNASGGVAGQIVTFAITTSGTTSFVLTWGTNYRKTGTLATGTVSARFFSVTFICINGTIWQEIARTIVQT